MGTSDESEPESGGGGPTLFVMVGLPGAGKTTRARELEAISAPNLTFEISDEDLDSYDGYFVEPQADELTTDTIDPPPTGFHTWAAWTADRWPTSMQPLS